MRDHVEEHLHERITLDDLATVAGIGRCRFLRRFRRSTGTSPHDFVLDRRVARAGARAPDGNAGSAPAAEAPGRGLAVAAHMERTRRWVSQTYPTPRSLT